MARRVRQYAASDLTMGLTRKEARKLKRDVDQASAAIASDAGDRLTLSERLFGTAKDQSSITSTPGDRGWLGRGAGKVNHVDIPPEAQGTTVQVCGLWPFIAGSGSPVVGVPLGRNLMNGSAVCADPIYWFLFKLINNPSCFILGRPHLGKSALTKRIVTVLSGWGVIPMVLSDTKGEYSNLIRNLDGQVVRLGRGQSTINPLDYRRILLELGQIENERHRREALEEMRGRRLTTFLGLLSLVRDAELQNHEETIITVALRILDDELPDRAPLVSDVVNLITRRDPRIAKVVRDRGEENRYEDRVEALLDTLDAISAEGQFGDMFARTTTEEIRMGKPVSFDMSGLDDADLSLQGAVQSVAWNYGSALVSAEKHLAEAGLREPRHYFLVMDELWRMLRASNVIVYFVDALTRLNRQRGLGQAMITHTMNDLKLGTQQLTDIAWGFVERSAMVYLGGLSEGEMGNLATVFSMTRREQSMITDWSAQGAFNPETNASAAPPGRGHFLLKVGKKPGTPFALALTDAEIVINDTNQLWTQSASRAATASVRQAQADLVAEDPQEVVAA